ncbi:MAG: hypothetical protein WA958_11040 [Tunicatimonas sp.]
MSQSIIRQLPRLRRESGKHLPTSTIYGFSAHPGGQTRLISPQARRGRIVQVPGSGIGNLLRGLRSVQKVMTFTASNRSFMNSLNEDLQGGDTFPWLLFGLGLVFIPIVGAVGTVGGVVFAASTTAIDSSRRTTQVMARVGDEIWHVEEVGRTFEDNYIREDRWLATHISSYFLVDPHRRHLREKGWLLHEDRKEIELSN